MNNLQSGLAQAVADPERQAFREGLKACGPTMPGIFAWALVTGMAMVKSGLTLWQALGMSLLVFAGSAQLTALPLIAVGTPAWIVFLTALVVNLRFLIFGAMVGPHFAHLPWYRRIRYGYFNADVIMALFPRRFPPETMFQQQGKTGYYRGVAYTNWAVWQTGSVAGILLASRIPQGWGIGFAGILALLALTVSLTVNLAALAGVAVASLTAVAAASLPFRLGLLLAVILGMSAAMAVDSVRKPARRRT